MLKPDPIGLGHNRPIPELLTDRYQDDLQSAQDLIAAADRLPAECAVDDQDTLDKLAEYVRQTRARSTTIDGHRSFEKQAFDAAGTAVQSFFNPTLNKLADAKRKAEGIITARNRRAEELARQRALAAAEAERAEARRRHEEAARLETAGKTVVADQIMEHAQNAERMAETMERQAGASSSDLVRTQTAGGTVSSKGVWVFQIEDQAALRATLGKLGDHFTLPEIEKAIRSLIAVEKKAGRDPSLPGVVFSRDSRAVIR